MSLSSGGRMLAWRADAFVSPNGGFVLRGPGPLVVLADRSARHLVFRPANPGIRFHQDLAGRRRRDCHRLVVLNRLLLLPIRCGQESGARRIPAHNESEEAEVDLSRPDDDSRAAAVQPNPGENECLDWRDESPDGAQTARPEQPGGPGPRRTNPPFGETNASALHANIRPPELSDIVQPGAKATNSGLRQPSHPPRSEVCCARDRCLPTPGRPSRVEIALQ